jgi:tyrosyl-tRNA synthetase
LVIIPAYINLCIKKEDCDKNKNPILNYSLLESEKLKDTKIEDFTQKMLKIFNPLELKIEAADYTCRLLFGEKGVEEGYDFYLKNIKKQGIPKDAIHIKIGENKEKRLADILNEYTGLSKSELRRISEQKGIKIIKVIEDEEKRTPLEPNYLNQALEDFVKEHEEYKTDNEALVLRVGKKYYIKIG